MIEQVIQLDMLKEPGRVPPRATVRRGESQTQKITARLTLDGADYTPTYSDARLRILHEDGTWAVCSATKGTASVSATLPSNCLSKAGRCRLAYFEFSSTNGYAETTENFELVVLGNVDGNGSDEAASYDDELLQLWNKWSAYEALAERQEAARVAAEAARAKAEADRASAESSRASAESERASAEFARATAETARANAEGDRASAESSRATAEASRTEAESSRVTAETSRASAESSRVAAETAREEACADAIEATETATAGAEKVNATLSGSILTVTDRTGASSSVDTGDKSELEERIGGIESLVRADGTGVEVARKVDGSYTSGRLTVGASGVTTNGAALSAGAVAASSLTAAGDVKGATVTSTDSLTAASATVSGATSTNTLTVSDTAKVGVATTSTYRLPGLRSKARWMRLGWWDDNVDSNSLIIDLYTGNGYNGDVSQNTHARIFVKNGWQSTQSQAKGAFGGTLQIVSGDGCDASGIQIALPAFAHNSCDVYVYFPWKYVVGWMQVSCNGGTWHADVREANYPTSGYTLQNVGWTAPTVSGLYWGTTLLGGMVGVKLWSGTLSKGGSITVNNLNRYRVLYLTTSWTPGVSAIGINRNDTTNISFCTGFDNGASYVEAFYFTKNSNTGTTLKYVCGSYHNVANSGEADVLTVTGIWGLI